MLTPPVTGIRLSVQFVQIAWWPLLERSRDPASGGIGEDIAETLDYMPGRFKVIRHIARSCRADPATPAIAAPTPDHAITRGRAGAGLLAHIEWQLSAYPRRPGQIAREGPLTTHCGNSIVDTTLPETRVRVTRTSAPRRDRASCLACAGYAGRWLLNCSGKWAVMAHFRVRYDRVLGVD